MHHTLAYANPALAALAVDTNGTPVQDDIIAISNNRFLPQEDYRIVAAYAQMTTANRTRISSPTNRQITLPFIRPIAASTAPVNDPNVADYRGQPFKVEGLEELGVDFSTDLGAATEVAIAALWLDKGFTPAPPGNIFTMRGTSTTAAAILSWTSLAVTWADSLPEGLYAVVGLEVVGVTEVLSRVILENQVMRPGSVASVLVGNRTHEMFRMGRLGNWGQFRSTRMPIVQVLNLAAIAVHTVYLDLIRIR
jgi:hypothetical protein